MAKWEYATVPLLVHATKQILDNWGDDGWELVAVLPGPGPAREQVVVGHVDPTGALNCTITSPPSPENLVAYMKRARP